MTTVSSVVLPHYDIQLRRGGRIAHMEWDEDSERHIDTVIHPNEIPRFLDATVCLVEEISLRDIMVMIERGGELFSDVASCEHISELLDEMRSGDEGEGINEIPVSLEIGWTASVVEGLLEFSPMFYGRSIDGDPVDLAFAPISWIVDLPVVVDESFSVVEDDLCYLNTRRMITLTDLVRGILSELTQLGSPQERNKAVSEIRDVMDGINSGTAEHYTEEEMMEHAALQAEEARKRFPCRVCGEDFRCACFDKPHDLCHTCFAHMKES